MDDVSEIKARLTIETLVGQYCQLKKKGRNFLALCPFHNDTHPSLLISPDKGIAYCFACQKGGDIFSFYQEIEKVDFPQALKDLAEKAGVELKEVRQKPAVTKDEKERLRECLTAAEEYFVAQLKASGVAQDYLKKRMISEEQIAFFGLGYAPDSFSQTYEYLLKQGFSRTEIVKAGLGVQRELQDGKIYDRFRNRLLFPVHDHQGNIVAFGGRAIGEEEAKYVNSSEGPLYNKSAILYGLHYAKEAIRDAKAVVMVEGYFDLLACHKVGCHNVVAVSGTALTEQHVKTLKRYAETAVLCLDQDRAGQEAAERAFHLLAREGMAVQAVTFEEKDPDEVVKSTPELLGRILHDGGVPYLDLVLQDLAKGDVSSATGKRAALRRLLPLIDSLASSVEQGHYIGKTASLLGTTETALREDIAKLPKQVIGKSTDEETTSVRAREGFSPLEIALGLFLLYPLKRALLQELIEPEGGFSGALYGALKKAPEAKELKLADLELSDEHRERAGILHLFCEYHGFHEWSEGMAVREIRKNCMRANRELLKVKQLEITRRLKEARLQGKVVEEAQLSTQYQQVLKLAQMAG
ncbi:MAG: DNA primase [Candidatus Peribacteraceae bacterium]|nr:DNA primase [Candidatus Peribacteraceae bacterium]